MISKLMLLEQVTIQTKKQQLLNKGISSDVIDKLLQSDPTNKDKSDTDKVGSYTDWIVSRYLKDRQFNDFTKLHSQLEQYDKSKHKIPNKQLQNIGQFKTLDEFITFVNNNQDKLAIKTDDFIVEEKNDYDMFYSRDFIIHVPHTKKQSIELGSGTKWCTSQINDNMFQSYYNDGYLFYITNKTTKQERYNLFLSMGYLKIEFTNDKDRHLTYKLFDIVKEDNTLLPQIKNYFEYKNIESNHILQLFLNSKTASDVVEFWKYNINNFADIYFEKNENKLLNIVNHIGSNLQFIPNPSIKIQLQQLAKDMRNIDYIEYPDNTVFKKLVSQDGYYIKYIIDAGIKPKHDVQLQQVSQDGYQIRHIIYAGITPDYDIQMQQVSQNGWQIKYIIDAGLQPENSNEWHEIQLQQVSQSGDQIRHIINAGITPDYDTQLQQVSQNGLQIEHIIIAGVQPENENEWHDVQMQQVKQNGWQIQYINNPSEKVQLQQVLQNEYQIQYIKNPNEELKLQQVSENGLQIQFITNPSEKVQLQQIKQNSDQYNYIENPTPKQTQLYKQLKGIKESTGYISKLLDVN